MHDTQSMHKGIYTLGNKTALVGTERADAATSCHIPMTAVQLPTSSPRTAQNKAYAHIGQALLRSTAHVGKRWACARGDGHTGKVAEVVDPR